MKKILLMSAAAAAMIFASCSKNGGEMPVTGSDGIAYLSISIAPDSYPTRAGSDEDEGAANEREIKSLHLVTFNDANGIVGVPGGTFVSEIPLDALTQPQIMTDTKAVKVSAAATKIVVIANAGDKLKSALDGLTGTSTFDSFNAAIKDANISDITGTNGFTMITDGGSDQGLNAGNKISHPCVAVNGKIKETAAEAEVSTNRVTVKLERLASKLIVKVGSMTTGDGGTFTFDKWTVDAVNSTYFPFAEKTIISAAQVTGGSYEKNFYTKDPNYTNGTGLLYAKVMSDYQPQLPDGNVWKSAAAAPGDVNATAYVIENTMDAAEQKFGNATRIVLRAQYYPENYAPNTDWFLFNGVSYASLSDLQAAYADADAPQSLKDACNNFYGKLKTHLGTTLVNADFAALTQADLDKVQENVGGQVVKDGTNQVIRWYQKGRCYYHYEIRHDNDPNAATSAFAKYGVVRNNWYNLNLTKVSGPGTPWYPEIEKPGPGDPKPGDPIDTKEGYLGISVEIAPWIIWETDFEV